MNGSKLHITYLSLGSNIEPREEYLDQACLYLSKKGNITKKSSFFENPPVGFESSTDFINICLEYETKLIPKLLLKFTQEIEKKIGRKAKTKNVYESRQIDIDILFIDDLIISEKHFKVPHPFYAERNFVLQPLYEINKKFMCPSRKTTIQQLYDNFKHD